MPYIKEIAIDPNANRRAELASSMRTYEGWLRDNRAALTQIDTELAECRTEEDFWTSYHDVFTGWMWGKKQANEMDDETYDRRSQRMWEIVRDFANHISRLESDRRGTVNTLARYEESLGALRRTLDSLPVAGERVLSVAALKQEINSPFVKSVRLYQRNEYTTAIRIVFQNLLMKPSNNRYGWINRGKDDFSIKLHPVVVDIWLGSNIISIRPTRGQAHLFPFAYSGGPQAHPHITNYAGNPCLGDFGGPINEALQTGDYISAVHLIQMFLEQANAEDPAGNYWPRWIDRRLGTSIRYNYDQAYNPHEGNYVFYRIDAYGKVTVATNSQNIWPVQEITMPANPPHADVPEDAEPEQTDTIENIAADDPNGYYADDRGDGETEHNAEYEEEEVEF